MRNIATSARQTPIRLMREKVPFSEMKPSFLNFILAYNLLNEYRKNKLKNITKQIFVDIQGMACYNEERIGKETK